MEAFDLSFLLTQAPAAARPATREQALVAVDSAREEACRLLDFGTRAEQKKHACFFSEAIGHLQSFDFEPSFPPAQDPAPEPMPQADLALAPAVGRAHVYSAEALARINERKKTKSSTST